MVGRNFSNRSKVLLNWTFVGLITASFLAALAIAYNFTSRYVYNEFERQKIDVLDETIKPYNDFFQNKIPEISFYQGYLDSASAANYSQNILIRYPFVHRILFYDTEISNHKPPYSFLVNGLSLSPRAVYQFGRKVPEDSTMIYQRGKSRSPGLFINEFNRMAAKFSVYLQSADTTKTISSDEILGVFYNISPNRITFMNIPREEELKVFQNLMSTEKGLSPVFEQDILSFKLDPNKLQIQNVHPRLFERINIKSLAYEPVEDEMNREVTELPLSGPFSNYKLYFSSSPQYLSAEISRRFLPLAIMVLLVYAVLVFIGFLIYRNLNINSKLFKLQYDFVNNLTHEFKTPVSVIKIAGNNIRSAKYISDTERIHYGKILDEEADKLNDLMNRLLSFTQIENHSIQVKYEEVNLDVFLQNLIDSYQLKYPEFEISFSNPGIEYFTTDPLLLSSLFQNLIDNAYKYSLPNRRYLHIEVALERNKIIFRFIDQGIGIPKSELKNIFKKFYRIQSEFNQQGSVGIGLAFCKELLNFMHGDITVKSKVGGGSEFVVVLPYS